MKRLTGLDIDKRILEWADDIYKENEPYRRAIKGGTGFKEYTTGDVLYASSRDALAKLAIGSSGQLLGVSGGLPAWTTPKNRGWELVADTTLGAAAATITVSGLAGDTDGFYHFELFVIGAVSTSVYIRPNNDATANNYRHQYIVGSNTSADIQISTTSSGMFIGNVTTIGDLLWAQGAIYATSGTVRLANVTTTFNINATTQDTGTFGVQWKNTADEITSLVFRCSAAGSPFDAGTRLRLWKAVAT